MLGQTAIPVASSVRAAVATDKGPMARTRSPLTPTLLPRLHLNGLPPEAAHPLPRTAEGFGAGVANQTGEAKGWSARLERLARCAMAAAARMRFRLKPDSVVRQKITGLQPIPSEQIGLYKDEYRRTLPAPRGTDWMRDGASGG